MLILGYVFIGLLGLIFGSFATVLCYRIPRDIHLGLFSHVRSCCAECQKVIPWYRNVPLVSYLLQRGRCAQCQAPISVRYPLIEFSTALFFLLTYAIHSHSVGAQAELRDMQDPLYYAELVKVLYFTLSLVVVVFIDIEFRIIPDRFSIGNWVVATLAALLWHSPSLVESLAGGALGFGIFFLLAWGYEKLKGIEGLGFGDVKMMGWLGAWIGVFGVPFVILIASLSGLIVGLLTMRSSKDGLQTAIPFGPFLAMGAYIAWALQSLGYW